LPSPRTYAVRAAIWSVVLLAGTAITLARAPAARPLAIMVILIAAISIARNVVAAHGVSRPSP
jgi:hypothetical protein